MGESLPKPWLDLSKYREVRLREAVYEAELAKRFLDQGLVRNAAGRVFQAWKALVAAYAVDKVDELRRVFPGFKKPRGLRYRVEKVYWVIAIMPTTALKPVAQIIGGEIDLYTDKALWIHEYQYNGPDPQGILSLYLNDDSAIKDINELIEAVNRLLKKP